LLDDAAITSNKKMAKILEIRLIVIIGLILSDIKRTN